MIIKKQSFKILFIVAILAFVLQGMIPKKTVTDKFIGLQLWSVREDMKKDPVSTIEQVGKMGYKFVEAAGFKDGKFYGMNPLEFRKLCEKNGIKFLGSHTGRDLPDAAGWDEAMTWWDNAIDAHAAAGVKWIVQPWMSKEGYNSLEGLRKYATYFNAVGEKCKAKGIKFGYHNHSKEFTTVFEGKPLYDWLLELTDASKVTMELDLYWITKGGKNPIDYFNKYPGRFQLWHIKDEKELGARGIMKFPPIFAEKGKAGLKYGIVEVEKYNYKPLESCKRSLEFLLNSSDINF
jgi:sugar phosphate isomerase/epimerase